MKKKKTTDFEKFDAGPKIEKARNGCVFSGQSFFCCNRNVPKFSFDASPTLTAMTIGHVIAEPSDVYYVKSHKGPWFVQDLGHEVT